MEIDGNLSSLALGIDTMSPTIDPNQIQNGLKLLGDHTTDTDGSRA